MWLNAYTLTWGKWLFPGGKWWNGNCRGLFYIERSIKISQESMPNTNIEKYKWYVFDNIYISYIFLYFWNISKGKQIMTSIV